MTDRKKPSIPFVNLHGHSTYSIFDGMGYPDEHVDFAFGNGLEGMAFTEHGNMNSFSHAFTKSKKMKEEGKDFKIIYGIEAYVHPSIDEWKLEREKHKEDAKLAKQIDEDVGLVVEDENESKKVIKSTLNQRSHLVLTAQNQEGLNNLFKMVSESYRGDNFYRFPRMDYDLLKRYNSGIIASTACIGGILGNDYWRNRELGDNAVLAAMENTVKQMMDIFGDRFYGELQWANYAEQHIINQHIITLSKMYGFKLISTCDAHFPSPDMWKDREIYKMIGWMGKKKDEIKIDALPQTLEEMEYQLYPKNGDELFAAYRTYSSRLGFTYDDRLVEESIIRTADIARNRISAYTPDTSVKLPSFVVPEGETADTALAKLAVTKLKDSGLYKDQVYIDRLKEELHTIKDRGFSKYFLTMSLLANKAKETQLCGGGRGSGAGSLVSYLLDITEVNPIKYNLQFSRFIRKNAKDYPDIDFDVSDPMVLKEMMINEYGESTVVPISNFNTLQARSLIKDISKLYDIPFQEVNDVTSKMLGEATPVAKKEHGITAGVYNPSWEELKKYSPSLANYITKYPHVAVHVENLQGQIRSISRHAGGVLFADNLDGQMPLINSGGVVQTPWTEGQTVRHLEPLGFIKFDILGLTTLRMIETAIGHILRRHHGIQEPSFAEIRKYYEDNLHPESIDLDDQAVYENVFQKGKFLGTFQFTNDGAQDFCKQAKPKNIIDIAAITSIYRPGPLSANVDKKYVEAKENPTLVNYIHPLVEEVTKDTYGFIVFQEQLSLLAHKLGNDISLDEGNELRKVLTKKGTGKEAQVKDKLYGKFIDGCVTKGIDRKEADKLWKTMEFFSGYGFNLSHAVCYSIISYQCAWLFNYYPAEWACAYLDCRPEDDKEASISLVKSYGFAVESLNINKSGRVWSVLDKEGKTLVQPLSSIKGLGDAAIEQIVNNRPFDKVEDLLFNEKIKYSKLNKKGLDALCRSGALNCLIDNRFSGGKHFWSVVAVDRPKTLKKFKENIDLYKPEGEFTDEEKIENISALIGIYPINLVMTDDIRTKLEIKKIKPIGGCVEIDEYGEEVKSEEKSQMFVWFIPRTKEEKKTKNGKPYWVVSVTDSTNLLTSVKIWGIRETDVIHMNRPYLAQISKDGFGFSIRNIKDQVKLLG
jgi:DNA polymerase-3 subunit alpha